jgi:hypothetical protein
VYKRQGHGTQVTVLWQQAMKLEAT